MKKIAVIVSVVLLCLGFASVIMAAEPVCPAPTQGYEITGCFVDANGDEWAHGGTVTVYDPLDGGYEGTVLFTGGTFLVDLLGFGTTAPEPAGYTCNAANGDYYVTVSFNSGGAGTPASQTYCVDGDIAVNGGGYDLTVDNGGAPYSTGTGPLAVSLQQFTGGNDMAAWLPWVVMLLLGLSTTAVIYRKSKSV